MRIFPASKYQLKASVNDINDKINKKFKDSQQTLSQNQAELKELISDDFVLIHNTLNQMMGYINSQSTELEQTRRMLTNLEKENLELRKILEIYNTDFQKKQNQLDKQISTGLSLQQETLGFVQENNWGIIFNNTIAESDWLKQTNFSLGRWAIGYQCAYVLFRVLDEIQPQSILELGLGQSTKFIGQYASFNPDTDHMIIENNPDWINFFEKNYEITNNSKIIQCDWVFSDYESVEHVRIFKGFDDAIQGKKFDLIMIDAPLGGDMPELARIDVLKNIPECLNSSFVILLDDLERSGEKNTFGLMQEKLLESNISFETGIYKGKKHVGVIVSPDFKFLTTM